MITSFLVLLLVNYISAQDPCSWQDPSDPSGYYDLLPLQGKYVFASSRFFFAKTGRRTFSASAGVGTNQWNYAVWVCGNGPACGGLAAAGYCQRNPGNTLDFGIGTYATFTVQPTASPPTITVGYTNGDEAEGTKRAGKLIVVCDPTATEPTQIQAFNPVCQIGLFRVYF